VLEANKVEKLIDHGYMDLGYSGFMNDVRMKKDWMPQLRATWVAFLGKKKVTKGGDKKLSK
jgi:hypothetical protein